MKQEIQTLIQQHKLLKDEVFNSLNELSLLDEDKLSEEDIKALRAAKKSLEQEYELRQVFINDLENLL